MIGEQLLEHLEAALGPLDESRSVSESVLAGEDESEFGMLALGSSAFSTFGISRHVLAGPANSSQELVVAVEDRDFAVSLLSTIGRHVLEHHRPLPARERHRVPGWDRTSAITSVMAVPDPDVGRFAGARPHVEFVRLVPITDAEAAYARQRGWQALERMLAKSDVRLSDLFRPSTV